MNALGWISLGQDGTGGLEDGNLLPAGRIFVHRPHPRIDALGGGGRAEGGVRLVAARAATATLPSPGA